MWLALEMETLARQYYMSLSIGGPVILPDGEIDRVMEKFKIYGLRSKQTPAARPRKTKRVARA